MKIGIFAFVLVAFVHCSANEQCSHTAGSSPDAVQFVRFVPGDFITFMRSNPAWSWAWFAANQGKYNKAVSSASAAHGTVAGDAKPDNVDIMPLNGKKAFLGLSDLDDGGRGSFLGDLFHTLSYNEVWPVQLSHEEAISWYFKGLKAKSAQSNIVWDKSDYLVRKNQFSIKVEGWAKNEEAFISGLKLTKIEDLTGWALQVYQSSQDLIERSVALRGNIIYRGVRVKENGGSTGVPRFTYLVIAAGIHKVIEAKYQPAPAVSATGIEQLGSADRLAELMAVYRPVPLNGGHLDILYSQQGAFTLKERSVPIFNGGNIPTEKTELTRYKDFLREMFFWLGQKHGAQSAGYSKMWEKNFPELEVGLKQMVNDHVAISKSIYLARTPPP